jgi:hypothetical protein
MSRSFAEIKALKKPNETSVEVILDPELTRSIEELQRRLATAKRQDERQNRAPEAPAIQKEIDELLDKLEQSEAKVEFKFRDPGRQKFDALVDACPPTEEDKKLAKEQNTGAPSWHPQTFVPGLISLCAVDPELSIEEATEIYNDWGRGDVEALFNSALQVCLEQASIPFTRRDTDAILASVRNLITQQNEESPTASS